MGLSPLNGPNGRMMLMNGKEVVRSRLSVISCQ
jgi:hypothetical protein